MLPAACAVLHAQPGEFEVILVDGGPKSLSAVVIDAGVAGHGHDEGPEGDPIDDPQLEHGIPVGTTFDGRHAGGGAHLAHPDVERSESVVMGGERSLQSEDADDHQPRSA